jgi:hypothetical protein
MRESFFNFTIWVAGGLMILNLLFLDFFLVLRQKKEPQIAEFAQTTSETPTPTAALISPKEEDCSSWCKDYIEERISKLSYLKPTEITTPTPKAEKTFSSPKIFYITIGSSGSTSNTSWTDIAGTDFYFDLADYQGAKAVRFEVSLQSYLSSDPSYIRIYDVSNKRAVDGSELTTRSSSFEYLQSGDLTIWRGNNLYRIQVKGSSGNLVNFTSPRLKIIF